MPQHRQVSTLSTQPINPLGGGGEEGGEGGEEGGKRKGREEGEGRREGREEKGRKGKVSTRL